MYYFIHAILYLFIHLPVLTNRTSFIHVSIFTGKMSTMYGLSDSFLSSAGIITCAVGWLFRLIEERKENSGARFSVRVSAVELSGKNEVLKDLLAGVNAVPAGVKESQAGLFVEQAGPGDGNNLQSIIDILNSQSIT